MSASFALRARTDLTWEAICRILFAGLEVRQDPEARFKYAGDDFYCFVSLLSDNVAETSDYYVLDEPENLIVKLYVKTTADWNRMRRVGDNLWNVPASTNYDPFATTKVALNWFRSTTVDCAYIFNGDIPVLWRVNGKTTLNSEWGAHSDELELIDIPYEINPLAIL